VSPRRDERGFALVIVMWLFTVLFVLGAEFAAAMRQDATATKNFADETQSYYLATAAANLTFYRAFLDRDRGGQGQVVAGEQNGQGTNPGQASKAGGQASTPGLNTGDDQPLVYRDGQWHPLELSPGVPLWGAGPDCGPSHSEPCVEVRITDEGGKIPINFPNDQLEAKLYPLLVHVLGNLGVDPQTAAGIADSVVDWEDPDDEHRVNGAESDYYQGLPNPYFAKNKRLDSIDELLLIKGITPELYNGDDTRPGLRDIFSIFNNTGQVNLRLATPIVKQVLFGLDPDEMKQIEQQQSGNILPVYEARLPVELQGGNLVSESDAESSILFVEAQAQLPSSRVKAHVGAVIDIEDSNEGLVLLRWMDQMAVTETS
jgi:hypothetical protein